MLTVRRALTAVLAFTAVALVLGDPAYAADTAQRVFTIPPVWLTAIAALLVNLATALTTRLNGRPWVKAIVAMFFVAVASLIQNAIANGGLIDEALINTTVITFVLTVVGYFGGIKPLRVPEVMVPEAGAG